MLGIRPKPVLNRISRCCCCGGEKLEQRRVLWRELIESWDLREHEVAYIDRQQGLRCTACGCNLRTMALASAIMHSEEFDGDFAEFVTHPAAQSLDVLEVNTAGELTPYLSRLQHHRLVEYPEVDMRRLPFDDSTFDMVLHSDTLEHVIHPIDGLRDCCRVLKQGGRCIFTIPLVLGRLTRSRDGLPPAYHGTAKNPADFRVVTEYGADAWSHVIQAGFQECTIDCLEYPAAMSFIAVKR